MSGRNITGPQDMGAKTGKIRTVDCRHLRLNYQRYFLDSLAFDFTNETYSR